MSDTTKTRHDLEQRLEALRARVAELERTEARYRKTQDDLVRARKDWEDIFQAIGNPAVILDPQHGVIAANRAVCRATGKSEAELLGRRCWEIFHCPDATGPPPGCPMQQVLASGHLETVEMEIEALQGFYLVACTPVLDANGQLQKVIHVAIDVTERKRAEQMLRFTSFAIDHTAEAVLWIRSDGRIAHVNEAACRVLGYSRDELLAMTVHDIDPDMPADVWSTRWQELKEAQTQTIAVHHRTKDGRIFPVEVMANFFEFEGQEYSCGFARDITKRKQAEQERAELMAQLYEAQKMEAVGQLAGGIAHDFNNLLLAIFSYASLARSRLPEDHEAMAMLKGVEDAADQAARVTKMLLTFSRKAPTDKRPVELGELVTKTMELLRRLLPSAIAIDLDVHSAKPLWLMADSAQLQQVIMNLAINARDAMPQGGTLTVSILKDTTGDGTASDQDVRHTARLVVRDTGVGMPPEISKHIFEPFFTTKPRDRGTGLGLSVIHGIVQDHRGSIHVESEEGRGTAFTIVLPCVDENTLTREEDATSPPPRGNGERLLLAEDDPHVTRVIASGLEALGYRVTRVASGPELLKRARRDRDTLQLLIIDMDLPGQSGLDCLRELRAGGNRTAAILITGGLEAELENELDAHTLLLRKPFQIPALGHLVARRLSGLPAEERGC